MKRSVTVTIQSLSLAFSLVFAMVGAQAQPVSHQVPAGDRKVDNFGGTDSEVIPQLTRFPRRLDYRQREAADKEALKDSARQAEAARVKAQREAEEARRQQIESYKKRQQMALADNSKAVSLGKLGHWEEAIAQHEAAVKLDPQNKALRVNLSAARTTLGQRKFAHGDVNAAATLFQQALSAAPDNALAGKLLSKAMERQGLDPNSADQRLALGDQLATIGDLEGASVQFQAAVRLSPSARTYVKMGDLAYRYGQVTTAINWYRQAIVKDCDYGPAHRELGLLLYSQKDLAGAASSLRKAVILDSKDNAAGQALIEIWRRQVANNPRLANSHLGLAGALQLTGDLRGADLEYRKAEEIAPRDPELIAGKLSLSRAVQHAKAERFRRAAETLYQQGLYREALTEIGQAVMLEPRNASDQLLLGKSLESLGDLSGAHQAYLSCVLIDPDNNQEALTRMRQLQELRAGAAPPIDGGIRTGPGSSPPAKTAVQLQLPAQNQRGPANAEATSGDSGSPAPKMPSQADGLGSASSKVSGSEPASHQPPAVVDELSKVTALESKRNYDKAINILRQLMASNLKNADLHHRLAVDLLAVGEVVDAVSEFRIAADLSPGKIIYASDLEAAEAIHKRSLMSINNAGDENGGKVK